MRKWIWPAAGVGTLALFLFLLSRGMNDTAICSGHDGVTFTVTSGVATCGGDIVKSGVLPIGSSLATKHDAAATLHFLGSDLTLSGDSTVTLVGNKRLAIGAGHLAGKISKQLVVDTGRGVATDGTFDIHVDANGPKIVKQ